MTDSLGLFMRFVDNNKNMKKKKKLVSLFKKEIKG